VRFESAYVGLGQASVFSRTGSDSSEPFTICRRVQAKAWSAAGRDVEGLEGEHKPMGVAIGFIAAMHGPETDSSVEQRLEVEAVIWRSFLFGEGSEEELVTA